MPHKNDGLLLSFLNIWKEILWKGWNRLLISTAKIVPIGFLSTIPVVSKENQNLILHFPLFCVTLCFFWVSKIPSPHQLACPPSLEKRGNHGLLKLNLSEYHFLILNANLQRGGELWTRRQKDSLCLFSNYSLII